MTLKDEPLEDKRHKNNDSYPSYNRRVALVLVDDHLKLPFELSLLLRVMLAVATSGKTGHVLDNHEAELITSLVE